MRFALIGAAGYIAPRHMEAIKKVGGELVAAYDPSDSVGVLDRYFDQCELFTEGESFSSFIEKEPVDYVAICSPNYLHEAHCRMALRSGANAICEKPLVTNPSALNPLLKLESLSGKRVWAIQQMRLHKEIVRAKEKYGNVESVVAVDYFTPRGKWYESSWKANPSKSGGLLFNIGVHLFDVLGFMFGELKSIDRSCVSDRRGFGDLTFERAKVSFQLSLNMEDVGKAKRLITINGEPFDVSDGFTDLHEQSYREILVGRGFGIEDARRGVEVVAALREAALRQAA
jgi:UDP-N-acetyl-2-amino-2-deoxyglucuronate dehydrogenase